MTETLIMMQPQKKRLGRGLAALIGDEVSEESVIQDIKSLRHLPIEQISPNPANPRRHFNEEEIDNLASSIRSKGLLQPLVVRPRSGGGYEIVAGERRWRAAQLAQIHDVPVLIRELDDRETLEIAIIVQRSDLNALEEANAYRQLIDQYSYTQQQLADSVGKSRSHIANTLRLLTLPTNVQGMIERGALTAGHARTLVASDDAEDVAAKIIKLGLTVREAEELSRDSQIKTKPKLQSDKDADTRALERMISDQLGMAVSISHKGETGGTLSISYKHLDQLDELAKRLTKS
jgi:ParB family transcriptional regulator, chromosome partitioning protein